MSVFLENLNEEQVKAVMHVDGPVTVIAGAGSGKTRVLTHRIGHILETKKVNPYNILAVTLTNKASREIKERIKEKLDNEFYDIESLQIYTFHALCAKILRSSIDLLGYGRDFEILSENEKRKYLFEAAKECGVLTSDGKFGRTKYTAKTFEKLYKTMLGKVAEYEEEIMKIREKFVEIKKRENSLDFDDLLIFGEKVLRDYSDVREKYQNLFKYILVDECQDTSAQDIEILKLLVNDNKNIFVVGDQNQGIYAFRGAIYSNIQLITKNYDSTIYMLPTNYRSSEAIVTFCNQLLKGNGTKIEYNQKSLNKGGNIPAYKYLRDEYTEINFVVQRIREHLEEGYKYSEIKD